MKQFACIFLLLISFSSFAQKKATAKKVKTKVVSNISSIVLTGEKAVAMCTGTPAEFGVKATGSKVVYQWMSSKDKGKTWEKIANSKSVIGAKTENLKIVIADEQMNGWYLKCAGTAGEKMISSPDIIISVHSPVAISAQPGNDTVCLNGPVNFKVCAKGSDITFSWEMWDNDAAKWTDLSGSFNHGMVNNDTSSILNITEANAAVNGVHFRCLARNGCGEEYSKTVTAFVSTINEQPQTKTTTINGNSSFSISAVGSGLSYCWQTNHGEGGEFENINDTTDYKGANSSRLVIKSPSFNMDYNNYRCKIADSCGHDLYSDAAALLVQGKIAKNKFLIEGAQYFALPGIHDDNNGSFTQTYLRSSIPTNKKYGIDEDAKGWDRAIWLRNLFLQLTYTSNADNILSYNPDETHKYVNRLDLYKNANFMFNFDVPLFTYVFSNKKIWYNDHKVRTGDFAHLYFEPNISLLSSTVDTASPFKVYSLQCSFLSVGVRFEDLHLGKNPLKLELSMKQFWIVPLTSSVNYDMNFQSARYRDTLNSGKPLTASSIPYYDFDGLLMYYLNAKSDSSSTIFLHMSFISNVVTGASQHYFNNYFQVQIGYSVNLGDVFSKLKNPSS